MAELLQFRNTLLIAVVNQSCMHFSWAHLPFQSSARGQNPKVMASSASLSRRSLLSCCAIFSRPFCCAARVSGSKIILPGTSSAVRFQHDNSGRGGAGVSMITHAVVGDHGSRIPIGAVPGRSDSRYAGFPPSHAAFHNKYISCCNVSHPITLALLGQNRQICHGVIRHSEWPNVKHSADVTTTIDNVPGMLQVPQGAYMSARTHRQRRATHEVHNGKIARVCYSRRCNLHVYS